MAVFQLPVDYKTEIASQLAQAAPPDLLTLTPPTTPPAPPPWSPPATTPTLGSGLKKLDGSAAPRTLGGETAASNRRTSASSTSRPSGLAGVPVVSREDYMTEGKPGAADYLGQILNGEPGQPIWKKGTVKGSMTLDAKGTAEYLDAKIGRVLTIAELAGYTPNERQALRDQITYNMQQVADGGDSEANLAALEAIIGEAEAPLAEQAIASTANGGEPPVEEIPGVYTPEQIAAIQASIGQFMDPYIAQSAQSATAGADVLREFAAGQGSPALGRLVNAQAAQMQAGGDKLAEAYMRQAQSLPAIQALEGQQQMAQQIIGLQNQLAQYQMQSQTGAAGGLTPELIAQLAGG